MRVGGHMKKIVRIYVLVICAIVGLAVGFASGLTVGQRNGFATGTEWAIVQADIIAREAGVFMPIRYESGNFRVVMQQPKHLYSIAWKRAEKYETQFKCMDQDKKRVFDHRSRTRQQ